MSPWRFLLDEMLSPAIAEQLRDSGHDALALVAEPAWRTLPDDDGRDLTTELVMALDAAAKDRVLTDGGGVLYLRRP